MRARVAVLLSLNVRAAMAVRAQEADPPISGDTIAGHGVTETVTQIMEREAALVPEPSGSASKPEHPILRKQRSVRAAPAVASWPPGAPPPRPARRRGCRKGGDELSGRAALGIRLRAARQHRRRGAVAGDGDRQRRIKVFDKAGNLGGLNTSATT
jgi:hypothetical protein